MVDLFTIGYSPWSEKARWALDHHRIEFRERSRYIPGLSVPWLRLRYRMPESMTMPLLVAGAERIFDSERIARWTDEHGAGSKLFPAEHFDEIEGWNATADEIADSGRAIFLTRLVEKPDARALVIPRWAARLPLVHRFVRARSRAMLQKYGGALRSEPAHRERMKTGLQRIREALAGKRYLLGRFTFADIAVASAVHCLTPVRHARVPIAEGARQVWTIAELASEFEELIRFRDALYADDR